MTETVVKAQGSLRWETETMVVESGSHHGQTILFQRVVLRQSAYYRYSVISGTTTDTSLSLVITEHTLH